MNELKNGLTRYFTEEQLDKIRTVHIFIAGCGGLGSNVAHMLVRSGFLHFTLLDFDRVEDSNLNRQFFFPDQLGMPKTEALSANLLKLEPELDLKMINKKISPEENIPELIKESHIIVEAFDDPRTKAVFVNGALTTGKPVIAASGLAGYGRTDSIVTKKISDNFFLVGDGSSDIKSLPPLAPGVCVAAAKQADAVLKIVLDT